MLGHAAAAIGSKIWIFGGQQGRKFLRSLYCFDTETCTWTRRDTDALPPARAGHSMVTVHGSVVYMFGGQGKRLYNDLYKFDPATATFTEVEASGKAPSARRGHSMVWDGRDYLVCFGGINQSATDAQLSVFSLSRGAWFTPQAFGPAPSARTQHTAQLISPGVILIFGGCNSSGTFFNDAVVLDTRTFTWHKPMLLNTAPAPRYHHTCSVVNGRVIIYGGINSKQTFDGVVVLETKLMSDISSVAEELFRMSADATPASLLGAGGGIAPGILLHPAGGGGGGPGGVHVGNSATPLASRLLSVSANTVATPGPSMTTATAAAAGPPPLHVMPGPPSPAPQLRDLSGLASELSAGLSSSKSLETVKIQLTDLLLRRNLEEQQLQTARKAETTESLLAKEREAREAAMKELLQYKLLLVEAEAAAASAQQELQTALNRANREAAEAADLRAQMEALQAKLSSREEELQEARLLQDGLVKELGIMASRYSRLAVDVQEGGERTRGGPDMGTAGGGVGERSGPVHATGSASSVHMRRTSLSVLMTGAAAHSRGTGRMSATTAGAAAAAAGADSNRHAILISTTNGTTNGSNIVDELPQSGSYSVPLPQHSANSMLSSSRRGHVPPMSTLSAACTASVRSSASHGTLGGPVQVCGSCCQQLLMLLSESEVHRASLLEANQALGEKVEELTAQNSMSFGQLQQMHADASALEPLSMCELEELERKLDSSARSVRDALMRRKIDEAQRRSSSEQATCAVCMEGPKAVVFNCGHQSCEACSGKVTSCPFCRVPISARIRLFDA